jgi:hypothetical protein
MCPVSETCECDDEYCGLMINQNRVSSMVLFAPLYGSYHILPADASSFPICWWPPNHLLPSPPASTLRACNRCCVQPQCYGYTPLYP